MRISNIKTSNYRQYQDNEIFINKCGEYDLSSVIARNGIGKSTLLNIVNWCLYQEEPHLGSASTALPIVNTDTLKKMEVGEKVTVKIEIMIESDRGKITFAREHTYRKTEEGHPFEIGGHFEAITNFQNEDTEIFNDEEADEWVNKLIPKRIREFFFFDGEQLDNYLISDKGSRIETSIYEVSQIDLLNKMEKRLGDVENDYRGKVARSKPQTDKINDEYERTLKLISDIKNEANICTEQIKVAKSELKVCEDFLRGQEDIFDLEEKRNKYNEDIGAKKKIRQEINNELKNFIREYTVLLSNYKEIKRLLDTIYEKESKGQLPPTIDRNFLRKMLVNNTCLICNRELEETSSENIQRLIGQLELGTELSHLMVGLKGSLEALVYRVNKYPNIKNRLVNSKNDINIQIDELEGRVNDIDNKLSNYGDKEQVKNIHLQRIRNEELINTNTERIGALKERLAENEKRAKELEEQLEKEIKKDKQHSEIVNCRKLVARAKDIVNGMISALMNDVRENVKDEMKKLFFELIWKKNTFKDVVLNEDYSMNLIHEDGYECLGTCSAAERELLALAFTLALHKVSGFDAPIIIDTPVSRVSDTNRRNFAKTLREVSKSKQLILLLTPSEYSEEVREIFEGVTNIIKLETLDERTVTIKEGIR